MPANGTGEAQLPAEGHPAPRRQLRLPEADEEYLEASGFRWETIADGGSRWLLLHGFAVPAGYNYTSTSIAIRLEAGYPDAALDMAYFRPGLARQDRKPIGALATQVIEGAQWQRWSRHRTGENPWRPGVDDISTHVALVEDWLVREFTIR